MYLLCQPPGPVRPGTLVGVRELIADYEIREPWGRSARRYLCRPPARLSREEDVLVTDVSVEPEGRLPLYDLLLRLDMAPDGHLLPMIEAGPDPETGRVYVATEWPAGGSLAAPASGREPDRARKLEAVETAARGVHALHEVGLAHGAIHAASVLFHRDAAVLDLPRLDVPEGEVLRVEGWRELVAVDPELLRGESPGRSSDIWALGTTLHSVLSDRPLFPGIDGDEAVTAVQRMMFTRPEPDPAIPPALLELIRDCVAPDPADRPGTALAVAERLVDVRA